jgi:hypothetical protein
MGVHHGKCDQALLNAPRCLSHGIAPLGTLMPLEAFGECYPNGLGKRLSGHGGELTGETVGVGVLDADGHNSREILHF